MMKLSWKRIKAQTKHAFRIARAGSSVGDDGRSVERVIVCVEHDGTTGFGEAVPLAYYNQPIASIESALSRAQSMLGSDPSDIDAIVDRLLESMDDQRAAVSAIDLALHDWVGKREQKPTWRILGLDPSKTPPTSYTIGIDNPDLLAEKVADAKRLSILKIKVGGDQDTETLAALKRLAPDKRLRVDANCGWSPDELSRRFDEMTGFGVELIEQPTKPGHFDVLRGYHGECAVPIVADEDSIRPSDIPGLVGAYDGINIKLSKCGGIREGRRMIELARRDDMKIMIGCMIETSLGVSGAAQIASLCDYVDLDSHLLLAEDPYEGLEFEDGVVRPGNGPGLGITERATTASC